MPNLLIVDLFPSLNDFKSYDDLFAELTFQN
jgi:hypothetical protein